MITSNNNKYVLKYYINLFYVVLAEIGSIQVSYTQVNDYNGVLKKIDKN